MALSLSAFPHTISALLLGTALSFGSTLAAGAAQQVGAPVSPPASPIGGSASAPEVHLGERLDPLLSYGPVLIESMAEVMERERRNPSETRLRKSRNGAQGWWAVPSRRSSFHAHSGEHYLIKQVG